jgi:endo-1,4-beta-xylanase
MKPREIPVLERQFMNRKMMVAGLIALALGLGAFTIGRAQRSSGADVLGADAFTAFEYPRNSADVSVQVVPVDGQSFKQAWRVTGLKPLEQPYLAQLSASSKTVIAKGDIMLVQFWAHAVGGAARTEFVFEQNGEPWDKSVGFELRLEPEWTFYSVPFKASQDFAVGGAGARFRLGYAGQTFEVGGFALKNFQKSRAIKDLPFNGFDYAGREPDAAWRTAANARIDQLRKADLRVKVVDQNGDPVPNAQVRVAMARHAFGFGSAVDAKMFLGESADSRTYRETILGRFNRVVLENDLKWPVWECCRRKEALEALKTLRKNGLQVRGHNLLWPCREDYCLPEDLSKMLKENDVAGARARIDRHFQDILKATRGRLVDWDVINEPSVNKRLAKVLGEDEMAAWFKRAHQLDPAARLFVNDYGNLGECCGYEIEFKRIVKRLLELGAPVDGLGLQAHFGYTVTPPDELFKRLTDLAQFGLPLEITELDINTANEAMQADYLRDFMTLAFSHPAVSGILMWGFWEGQHWLPDAALWRKDWSLKPNGKAWTDLVNKTWWTDVTGQADSSGGYETRGFLGKYTLSASLGSRKASARVSLVKSGGEFILKLP